MGVFRNIKKPSRPNGSSRGLKALSQSKGLKALSQSKGFTMIEILVVIAIIGVLSGIVFIVFTGIQKKAVFAATKAEAVQAARLLEQYKTENGGYPGNEDAFEDAFDFGDDSDYGYEYDYEGFCDGGECEDGEIADEYSFSIWPDDNGEEEPDGGDGKETEDGVAITSEDNIPKAIAAPTDCPEGFIPVPGSATYGQPGFCVMKYEAKNVGGVAVSQPEQAPWGNITYTDAVAKSEESCDGCHLINNREWMTLVKNILKEPSNWEKGYVGTSGNNIFAGFIDSGYRTLPMDASSDDDGYFGYIDGYEPYYKRTLKLSNGQIIWDLSGNLQEYVKGIYSGTGIAFKMKDGSDIQSGTNPEWSNIEQSTGINIQPNPFPGSLGVDGVSDELSYSQRLGAYNGENKTISETFLRGGYWGSGQNGGLLSLNFGGGISSTTGFRAAR